MFATDDIPHPIIVCTYGGGGQPPWKWTVTTFPDPEWFGPHLFNLPVKHILKISLYSNA